MKYPGGKNNEGTFQWLINHMPPHVTYIEGFLGSGAIMRLKKPAQCSIGIDSDSHVVEQFRQSTGVLARKSNGSIDDVNIFCDDTISYLQSNAQEFDHQTLIYLDALVREIESAYKLLRHRLTVSNRSASEYLKRLRKDVPLYLDPPYLMSTRRSKEKLYKHELTDEQHVELLHAIKSLKCMVMISGYISELYATELAKWRTDSLRVITRGGKPAIEYLWLNFPPPIELHDYRYLGANFREREKIKRQKQRWIARLRRMPDLQRWAMFEAIDTVRRRDPQT